MYWFFSFGGFSLSLCFCGVRERDRRLFLLFLGSVSTQSGEDGGSGGGWGGGGGSGVVVAE